MIIEGYAYLGKRNPKQEILLTVYKSPRDKAEKVTVIVVEGEGIPVDFKKIRKDRQ